MSSNGAPSGHVEAGLGQRARSACQPCRVDEEDGFAAVQLGVDRVPPRVAEPAAENRGRHRDADHPQLVEPASELAQRGVDVRLRQDGERGEPAGELARECGVLVVDETRAGDRGRLVLVVRHDPGDGEDLLLDLRLLHRGEALGEVGVAVRHHRAPAGLGDVLAHPGSLQQLEVAGREVVRVNVETHAGYSRSNGRPT